MFITIDGIDGAGKTTQLDLLCEELAKRGNEVARFRDPGSTKLGEAVREILLHREDIPLAATSEMLLYMSARSQLVDEQIKPALNDGKTIVCDRFLLANVVYQGVAGGLDTDRLWEVGRVATQGVSPDKTILLDLSPEVAFNRIQRGQDRLEKRGLEYFRKVREGFAQQIGNVGGEFVIIDASQSVSDVHALIMAFVDSSKPA